MSILVVPGSPFYANGTDNCFYPNSTAPSTDQFAAVPGELVGLPANQTGNIDALLGESVTPTNSTTTDTGYTGDVFNNFFDTIDAAAKTMEVMRHVISGEYIFDTIGNFGISCHYNSTGHLVVDADPAIWVLFKDNIKILVILLTVFTLFYWATGRGHILTS